MASQFITFCSQSLIDNNTLQSKLASWQQKTPDGH
ncbi:hypothetical protein MY4038_002445 [Beauveria bassiana]